MSIPHILFAAHSCYLDSSNGAAVASRELMQTLARHGFAVEVLCGSMLNLLEEVEPAAWLRSQGLDFQEVGGGPLTIDASGVWAEEPAHFLLSARGVPVTMHRGPTTKPHRPDAAETREFLALFERVLARSRPDMVVGYGGSPLARVVFARARGLGITTLFDLHNFQYHSREPFKDIDVVRVPSQFAAEHYREALGLECTVLPYLVDGERVRVDRDRYEPKYVTFVNPSVEKGVFPFARIADELGWRRPDIPLLVVEARGSEATLAGCGLDLRVHGNVNLMALTNDPRRFWRWTRLCLMPSLWQESQGLVAVEAMLNGIPVIASNRGALPETLGAAGLVLPLPDRLTPQTRALPTAEEVAPWVEAILRLWEDSALYEEHRLRALAESQRWAPEVLEPRYERFFGSLAKRRDTAARPGSFADRES
ncbi:hypothetical protein BH23PLA1_BH23PLA1_34030 [soil metagenome]